MQTQHTFKTVFDEKTTQQQIFDNIALPLVEDTIQGKNSENDTLYYIFNWSMHVHVPSHRYDLANNKLSILDQVATQILVGTCVDTASVSYCILYRTN